MTTAIHHYFLPCPRGLEPALADELAALGAQGVKPAGGGVGCQGPLALAYRAQLRARLPSRMLLAVGSGGYRKEDDLYRLALDQPWEAWFGPQRTLRVDVTAIRSPLRSLNFATLRIKDGIVDRLRERCGERPSIDTARPDVRVFAFLREADLVLYLDLSGEPLFKRGWRAGRESKGEAPLKENLAAGLIALSGWTAAQSFADPFCGAGTIAIEAAQMALGVAPGLGRSFGIERLALHDANLERQEREAAAALAVTAPGLTAMPSIVASDLSAKAISMSRDNARRAGLPEDAIRFAVIDAADISPADDRDGCLISNPPYDERVPIVTETWRAVGATLRGRFGGWKACLLTSDRQLPGKLGLRERRKTPLFNGALECRLFEFEMRRRSPVAPDGATEPAL